MQISMTERPLVSACDDPLFSADALVHPSGVVAQRRASITVGEVEEIYRRAEAARGRTDTPSDVPDIEVSGTVIKMNVQTDKNGAVLVAYTRDAETGKLGRSFIRFDLTGVNYIRRRLAAL